MGKYGQAAVKAVEFIHTKNVDSPIKAWEMATSEIFEKGSWAQKKGCPKNAFLGLCEEGLIDHIPKGVYNSRKSSKNKTYAVRAVKIISEHPNFLDHTKELWEKVTDGSGIVHNYQLDVVKALIKKKYIQL